MATLGRREMTKKNRSKPSPLLGASISAPNVNLTTGPIKVELVTTFGCQPASVGSPIMREDFITNTGIMAAKA